MFFKTASVSLTAVYQSSSKFQKLAAKFAEVDDDVDKPVRKSINLISKPMLTAIAKIYDLSNNIEDYIFPVYRAVTADVPNNNGDNFLNDELTRFSPIHRCLVYQTFKYDPFHIEHMASDPKAARGFLPDTHYSTNNPKDKHVLVVAAVDMNKDIPLSQGILSGELNSVSMGCICDSVRCSYCHKTAKSDFDLCNCLRWHKMARINGKLVYEDCLGVEFQELSQVGEGADPRATEQAILRYEANLKERKLAGSFSPIASLVSKEDQVEIAKFVHSNIGKLPDSMIRLANKLFH